MNARNKQPILKTAVENGESEDRISTTSVELELPEQKHQLPGSFAVEIDELSVSALEDILQIAKQRAALLDRLREAVRNDDINEIQKLAAVLCGLLSDTFEG